MSPPDPNERPERDPYEDDEEVADEAPSSAAFDLEALKARGDVPGLLALAKAYRSGTAPAGRDMAKCFEAYRAAAELGSGEAAYAVALYYLNGGSVVGQDLREGTTFLRTAAEKGSVPAKVYLGNLYELGIHYKADPEKADVWYRNAARSARVESQPGSAEWVRALADLGCARQVLLLASDDTTDDGTRSRLLARAKAHGYGLKIRDDAAEADRATFVDALAGAEAPGAPIANVPYANMTLPRPPAVPTATPPPVEVAVRERKDTTPDTKTAKQKAFARSQSQPPDGETTRKTKAAKRPGSASAISVGHKLGAFGYAILFLVAGFGAAYAATLGARELVTHGHPLPGLGARTHLVFPIVLGLVGVLPATLVYRFGAFLKALLTGAAFGGIGWVAWGTGQAALAADRALQALAFGVGGFLAGLLVFGLLGGVKPPKAATKRFLTSPDLDDE